MLLWRVPRRVGRSVLSSHLLVCLPNRCFHRHFPFNSTRNAVDIIIIDFEYVVRNVGRCNSFTVVSGGGLWYQSYSAFGFGYRIVNLAS
jgi:hypothetical protein